MKQCILILCLFLFCTGCGQQSITPVADRPPAPNGAVVKIVNQGGYYNLLINNEGKIKTVMISVYNITFIEDVKAGEKMWIENDPDKNSSYLLHIHSIKEVKNTSADEE